jgi:hypothetical protein
VLLARLLKKLRASQAVLVARVQEDHLAEDAAWRQAAEEQEAVWCQKLDAVEAMVADLQTRLRASEAMVETARAAESVAAKAAMEAQNAAAAAVDVAHAQAEAAVEAAETAKAAQAESEELMTESEELMTEAMSPRSTAFAEAQLAEAHAAVAAAEAEAAAALQAEAATASDKALADVAAAKAAAQAEIAAVEVLAMVEQEEDPQPATAAAAAAEQKDAAETAAAAVGGEAAARTGETRLQERLAEQGTVVRHLRQQVAELQAQLEEVESDTRDLANPVLSSRDMGSADTPKSLPPWTPPSQPAASSSPAAAAAPATPATPAASIQPAASPRPPASSPRVDRDEFLSALNGLRAAVSSPQPFSSPQPSPQLPLTHSLSSPPVWSTPQKAGPVAGPSEDRLRHEIGQAVADDRTFPRESEDEYKRRVGELEQRLRASEAELAAMDRAMAALSPRAGDGPSLGEDRRRVAELEQQLRASNTRAERVVHGASELAKDNAAAAVQAAADTAREDAAERASDLQRQLQTSEIKGERLQGEVEMEAAARAALEARLMHQLSELQREHRGQECDWADRLVEAKAAVASAAATAEQQKLVAELEQQLRAAEDKLQDKEVMVASAVTTADRALREVATRTAGEAAMINQLGLLQMEHRVQEEAWTRRVQQAEDVQLERDRKLELLEELKAEHEAQEQRWGQRMQAAAADTTKQAAAEAALLEQLARIGREHMAQEREWGLRQGRATDAIAASAVQVTALEGQLQSSQTRLEQANESLVAAKAGYAADKAAQTLLLEQLAHMQEDQRARDEDWRARIDAAASRSAAVRVAEERKIAEAERKAVDLDLRLLAAKESHNRAEAAHEETKTVTTMAEQVTARQMMALQAQHAAQLEAWRTSQAKLEAAAENATVAKAAVQGECEARVAALEGQVKASEDVRAAAERKLGAWRQQLDAAADAFTHAFTADDVHALLHEICGFEDLAGWATDAITASAVKVTALKGQLQHRAAAPVAAPPDESSEKLVVRLRAELAEANALSREVQTHERTLRKRHDRELARLHERLAQAGVLTEKPNHQGTAENSPPAGFATSAIDLTSPGSDGSPRRSARHEGIAMEKLRLAAAHNRQLCAAAALSAETRYLQSPPGAPTTAAIDLTSPGSDASPRRSY